MTLCIRCLLANSSGSTNRGQSSLLVPSQSKRWELEFTAEVKIPRDLIVASQCVRRSLTEFIKLRGRIYEMRLNWSATSRFILFSLSFFFFFSGVAAQIFTLKTETESQQQLNGSGHDKSGSEVRNFKIRKKLRRTDWTTVAGGDQGKSGAHPELLLLLGACSHRPASPRLRIVGVYIYMLPGVTVLDPVGPAHLTKPAAS